MKTSLYIVILFLSFSCNKLKNNKPSSVLINDKSQTDNKIQQLDNDFINRIKALSIVQFPFDFIDCDTNVLNELEKPGSIETMLNIEIDSLTSLNKEKDSLFYPITIEKIHNSTSIYSPEYYYFLINNKEEDTSISFSDSYIFKRLKPLNQIEVLLLITKIYDVKLNEMRTIGTQIDLLTFNIKLKRSIDRKRLITVGIGLEDISYYECFNISSNYDIKTKSFMHLEDESTSIIKNLTINPLGEIVISKPKVIVTN